MKTNLRSLVPVLLSLALAAGCSTPTEPTLSTPSVSSPSSPAKAAFRHLASSPAVPIYQQYAEIPGNKLLTDEALAADYASLQDALLSFSKTSFTELVRGKEKSGNLLYAPLSLYTVLAMLRDAASSETASLLETVLQAGAAQDPASRQAAYQELVARQNFDMPFANSSRLFSNALWLKGESTLTPSYQATMEEVYRADAYAWEQGEEVKVRAEMGRWIEEKTKGLLSIDQLSEEVPNEETTLLLLNALYYKSSWDGAFDPADTKEDRFTQADGTTILHDFMHKTRISGATLRSDYTVSALGMEDGSQMRFLLPVEGADPLALPASETFWQDLLGHEQDQVVYMVDWSIPLADLNGSMDLLPLLKTLGLEALTDEMDLSRGIVFDSDWPVFLSGVEQAVRLKMHEKGVEAAAVTIASAAPTSMEVDPPSLEMTLDRPFYLALLDSDGTPLIIALVETPAG